MVDLRLRMMTDSDQDTALVVWWRNQPDARTLFFNTDVVTPDTHRNFIATRQPHDLVYMIEVDGQPVGMCALTVDVKAREAEFGRIYIDPEQRGRGYARVAVQRALWYSFEILRLNRIWIEAFEDNRPILALYESLGLTPIEGQSREVNGRRTVFYEISYETWRSLNGNTRA